MRWYARNILKCRLQSVLQDGDLSEEDGFAGFADVTNQNTQAFFQNSKLHEIITDVVLAVTDPLLEEIKALREEVSNLKSSNIDLIRLLTNTN